MPQCLSSNGKNAKGHRSYHFLRYGYQLTGKGKWINMTLKKPKAKGGKKKEPEKKGKG